MSSRQSRYGTFAQRGAARRIASFVSRRIRGAKRSKFGLSRGMKSSTKTHAYTRTIASGITQGTNDAIRINSQSATGLAINGAGTGAYNMEIRFNLSGVDFFINGGAAPWYQYAMPNFTDFTNLYDNYRIDYIDCTWTFNSNNSSTTSPSTSLPRIFHVEDHDDTTATNMTSILQYDNLKVWQLGIDSGVMHRVRIHPTPLEMVYYSAALTGYQKGSNKKWINTDYPTIPHYGVKMIVDPIFYTAAATDLGYLAFSFKYHITCHSTK